MEFTEIVFKIVQGYTVLGVLILFLTPTKISRKHLKKFILATGPIGWVAAAQYYFLKKIGAMV